MDNKTKIQNKELMDLYYYQKKDDGSVATVCLLINDNDTVIARGVALCSPQDLFIKRKGRAIAQGRAVKAIEHRMSFFPSREWDRFLHLALQQWSSITSTVSFKSEFLPEPSPFEADLVGRVRHHLEPVPA